jgi:hypothetical protein
MLQLLMDPLYGKQNYDDSATLMQQLRNKAQMDQGSAATKNPALSIPPDVLMQLLNPGKTMGTVNPIIKNGTYMPHSGLGPPLLPVDPNMQMDPNAYMRMQGPAFKKTNREGA